MATSTISDMWGNPVNINKLYISHRNRLIDVHLIHTFQTKGRRLLVNTFKQNTAVPTMCIFFENKETAELAYEMMRDVYYGPVVPVKEPLSSAGDMLMTTAMLLLSFVPVLLVLAVAYKDQLESHFQVLF